MIPLTIYGQVAEPTQVQCDILFVTFRFFGPHSRHLQFLLVYFGICSLIHFEVRDGILVIDAKTTNVDGPILVQLAHLCSATQIYGKFIFANML